jgi:predicted transposase YbfD/YdcC
VQGSTSDEWKAIHIVSTWADERDLALGQVQIEEESNEITAILALLEALDVSGCIVTVDATDCQKTIVRKGLWPPEIKKHQRKWRGFGDKILSHIRLRHDCPGL